MRKSKKLITAVLAATLAFSAVPVLPAAVSNVASVEAATTAPVLSYDVPEGSLTGGMVVTVKKGVTIKVTADQNVNWTSNVDLGANIFENKDNSKVLTIKTGTAGTYTITATAGSGSDAKSTMFILNVTDEEQAVTAINVDLTKLDALSNVTANSRLVNIKGQITDVEVPVTVSPSYLTNNEVTLESNNKSLVKVGKNADGVPIISTVGDDNNQSGTATVSVKVNGVVKDTFFVTVEAVSPTLSLNESGVPTYLTTGTTGVYSLQINTKFTLKAAYQDNLFKKPDVTWVLYTMPDAVTTDTSKAKDTKILTGSGLSGTEAPVIIKLSDKDKDGYRTADITTKEPGTYILAVFEGNEATSNVPYKAIRFTVVNSEIEASGIQPKNSTVNKDGDQETEVFKVTEDNKTVYVVNEGFNLKSLIQVTPTYVDETTNFTIKVGDDVVTRDRYIIKYELENVNKNSATATDKDVTASATPNAGKISTSGVSNAGSKFKTTAKLYRINKDTGEEKFVGQTELYVRIVPEYKPSDSDNKSLKFKHFTQEKPADRKLSLAVGEKTSSTNSAEVEEVSAKIHYYSTNTAVATVSEDGTVTAVAAGEAKIYAVAWPNTTDSSSYINVSVSGTATANSTLIGLSLDLEKIATKYPSIVSGIDKDDKTGTYFFKTNGLLTVSGIGKDIVELPLVYSPVTVAAQTITWTSSDETVAIVSADNKVTTFKSGYAVLTGTAANGVKVTVTLAVSESTIQSIESVTEDTTYNGGDKAVSDANIANQGVKFKLAVKYLPATATIGADAFTFTSSRPDVATVDENGVVNTLATGTTVIKVASKLVPGVEYSYVLTVSGTKQTISKVTPSVSTLTLKAGAESLISATTTPSYVQDKELTYTSSDESIAKVVVAEDGTTKVVAQDVKTATSATITVAAKADSKIKAEIKVNVEPADIVAEKISIKINGAEYTGKQAYDLTAKGTATLSATVTPENAIDTKVKWTSSDENIATVDENGVVTATGKGTALITATTSNGISVSTKVRIKVPNFKAGKAPADGKMTFTAAKAAKGKTYSKLKGYIEDVADDATYTFTSSNKTVATINKKSGKITFKGVKGSTTITVKVKQYGQTKTLKVKVTVKAAAKQVS